MAAGIATQAEIPYNSAHAAGGRKLRRAADFDSEAARETTGVPMPKEEKLQLDGHTWTTMSPRKSGTYWLCSTDGDPLIVKVVRGNDRIFVHATHFPAPFEIEDSNLFTDLVWLGPL